MKITVYYHNGRQTNGVAYDAKAIRTGTAEHILGRDDATGNGIPLKRPLVQIVISDTETATYDADNVDIRLGE